MFLGKRHENLKGKGDIWHKLAVSYEHSFKLLYNLIVNFQHSEQMGLIPLFEILLILH